MSREGALLITLAIAVVLIGLMGYGWWRRSRRDSGLVAPFGTSPVNARILAVFPGLYVATTVRGTALERLAVRGLRYRAKANLVVTDAGLVLDLAGQEPIFLAAARIDEAQQATVTIDRVVERDGLLRLGWRLDDGTAVDSYYRPQDASARAAAAAISPLLPSTTPTGSDA